MKLLDIGALSRASGVAPSALRYYEEIGLIRSVARRGLRRQFEPEAIGQLALIALGKLAGFSLTEIAGMFGADGSPSVPRPALHARADVLETQIRELTALRDMLRHVADCPETRHTDCPKFQRLMRLAAKAAARRASRS